MNNTSTVSANQKLATKRLNRTKVVVGTCEQNCSYHSDAKHLNIADTQFSHKAQTQHSMEANSCSASKKSVAFHQTRKLITAFSTDITVNIFQDPRPAIRK
jgi:hypothetical protein